MSFTGRDERSLYMGVSVGERGVVGEEVKGSVKVA